MNLSPHVNLHAGLSVFVVVVCLFCQRTQGVVLGASIMANKKRKGFLFFLFFSF